MNAFKRWIVGHQGLFIIGVLLAAVVGYLFLSTPRHTAALLPHGKAAFYKIGFFRREEHELARDKVGHWRVFGGEPFIDRELLVPFECPYNDYQILRFEDGGRVYLVDKKNQSRTELRVVNGEWSYDTSDHWQSIFDLYP